MKKVVVSVFLAGVLATSLFFSGLFSPQESSAQSASEQAQIQTLLLLIGQLQQQLATLLAQQNSACTILTQNMYIGLYDYNTGGQVSKLQKFLKAQGDFTHPTITGFYGAATQKAVQSFQARVGLVSGGTPAATGYGVAGPSTRAKIQSMSCGGAPVTPAVPAVALPAVIPGGATVSCSPSATSIIQGQSITWSATATGGTPPYTFSWSGTNNLSGFAPTVTKTYNSTGVKSASISVSGSSPVSCSATVTVAENPALNYNISCSASSTAIPVGGSVTWTSSVSGGTPPYTYSWSGSENLSGSGTTVSKTYANAGLKEATLTINGVDEADCSNEVQVGAVVVPGESISWPPSGLASKAIYSLAWPGLPAGAYQNIFSFFWVGAGGGNVANPVSTAISQTLSAIASQPSGHKSIRLRNVEDWLFKFKDLNTNTWTDMCIDPATGQPAILHLDLTGLSAGNLPHLQGNPIVNGPMPCFWWDNGKNFTKNWLQDYFSGIKNSGTKIDHIVLDTEALPPYGGYGLGIIQDRCEANRAACPVSWCEAMIADPRFAQLDDFPFPTNFLDTVCNKTNNDTWWNYVYQYDEWVFSRMADYLNEAVYDVASNYFPDVTMSDYGFLAWDEDYPVPYGGNLEWYLAGGDGAIAGTHQAPYVYGDMTWTQSQYANAGIPNFPPNAFNSFKFFTNWAKSAALSDSALLSPWITDKMYAGSQVASSDLYQEMLIHAGMANTDYFLYFSGYGNNPPAAGISLMNNVISELELMIGYSDAEMITDDITDWGAQYVYTGMRVGDYNVWRFTPNLSGGQSVSSVIQSSGNANGTQPVILSFDGDTLTFDSAMVYTPSNPVSQNGIWIIQNASVGDDGPQIAYASMGGGQFAAAWEGYQNMGQYILDAVLNVKENLANVFLSLFWE